MQLQLKQMVSYSYSFLLYQYLKFTEQLFLSLQLNNIPS